VRPVSDTSKTLRDGPSALLKVRKLCSHLILRSERSERLEGCVAEGSLSSTSTMALDSASLSPEQSG
jgi:hypothetical protein